MLLQQLIDTYEEIKKNVYIIKRGNKYPIIIKFKNDNFFHLVGLHKTNIDLFIPNYIKSKSKKYKYIKNNVKKFNNILLSEINDNESLQYRITTFHLLLDILKGFNTYLYNLQPKKYGSLYDGDYGLLKIYEKINCLLGLVISDTDKNNIKCAPQSWMASEKINYLIENKKPFYLEEISCIPIELFDESNNLMVA
ncbi:MAG: hypothetical protein J6G98_01695 [Bacilli bacterium]|nr:hypothetical protein [Bacilli bacterium]